MPSRPKISATTRRQVAEWADHRCSYCRSPEIVGIPMVIEHIIPLAAGGSSAPQNLCLACYRCNEFKGSLLTAIDPLTGISTSFFHPRQQLWQDHFAWSQDGVQLIGITPCGRAMVEVLHLNSDWLIRARRIWIIAGIHPPLA
ncbi:MAG: HNH endonuclease [Caldilineaceae bacterium]